MNVQLNHTIVWCSDQARSAAFITRILGLPPAKRFLHFLVVELSNEVSIDYFETTDPIALQHLAFKVSETDFDIVLGRLRAQVPQIWADPARTQPGEINHYGGG
ncbi:MAG TPA: VOC family protein, partial [Burkholderiaceae bacterium]|nr:VOC family protein [Burkholderiaceae bacterium]